MLLFGVCFVLYFIKLSAGKGFLTLSSTLSSNPKSSHSVDPQFSHKLLFYVH